MRRALALLIGLILVSPLLAWHHEGHHLIAREAVAILPNDVPEFFRGGAISVAHTAVDPDLFRDRTLPQVTDTEAPEHYLDIEELQGRDIPLLRSDYLALINELHVTPRAAGFLPYAVTEWTQKLTIAFAEHRHAPSDPNIRAKCFVFAGLLSHYAGDLAQPLHTTVHYNGRSAPGKKSPSTGIHAKVDDLLYRFAAADLKPTDEPKAFDDVFTAVMNEIDATHKLVDRVYELEPQLPKVKEKVELTKDVREFALDRGRRAVWFDASLILTAWRNSEKIKLPEYLDRPALDAAP